MLVALLVGAIRSTARFCSDPSVVLNELNQRLLGRGDAPPFHVQPARFDPRHEVLCRRCKPTYVRGAPTRPTVLVMRPHWRAQG